MVGSLVEVGVSSIPNAFLDGVGTIPVNPLVATAVGALLNAGPSASARLGGWQADERGAPVYRQFGKKAGEIRAYFAVDGATADADAWTMVSEAGVLTLDILVSLLAQLCDPRTRDRTKYPVGEPAALSASKIMRYKNLSLWAANRAQFVERIAQEIRCLESLRFDLVGVPVWDPSRQRWNPSGVTVKGIRLFEIGEAEVAGSSAADGSPKDRAWLVRFGMWTQWWLNTTGKVWTGSIPKEVVELDHRSNRGIELLAKKIALNSFVLWNAIRSRAAVERRVENLLEDIGELPASGDRTGHWAGRMRDRFDEALLLLRERGVVDDVQWNDRFAPGAADRSKGWVEPWLASKVLLQRPSWLFGGPNDESVPKSGAARTRSSRADAARSAIDLRANRVRYRITQSDLADALGVSPSLLSQIETGQNRLSTQLHQRAERFFSKLS